VTISVLSNDVRTLGAPSPLSNGTAITAGGAAVAVTNNVSLNCCGWSAGAELQRPVPVFTYTVIQRRQETANVNVTVTPDDGGRHQRHFDGGRHSPRVHGNTTLALPIRWTPR
jgi:hypothetical protein